MEQKELPTPTADQIANFNAYHTNFAMMNEVARQMKEIPMLPSEIPSKDENGKEDVNPLIRVEFPEQGGVLTYMGGHDHPYKGFPFAEFVDKIDSIKKVQRAVLSSFYHSLKKRNKLQVACLLFVPWLFSDMIRAFIYTFFRLIDRFKLKTIRYCDTVREIHRAFSSDYLGEDPVDREVRHMLRDILCMLLELDNAYRFRFQDIIVELSKDNLRKNPAKELLRLLELMSSRENTQEVKDTWKLVRYFLPWYFRLNRSFKKATIDILTDLDLSKIALSIEDKHYCEKRKDYHFGYM